MEDVKRNLQNLINALTNLSPSRNMISQFILLLPEKYQNIDTSFPEIIENRKILEKLGILFDNKISRKTDSFLENLYNFIHETFDWLSNEREELVKICDNVHDPYSEWVELVLRKIMKEPNGYKALKLLKDFIEYLKRPISAASYEWVNGQIKDFFEKKMKEYGLSPAEVYRYKRLLIDNRDSTFIRVKERYENSEHRIYLRHSKYHIDILLKEVDIYAWERGYKRGYDYHYNFYIDQSKAEKIKRILEKLLYEGD